MPADPYKYFRIEARELLDGLKAGALDLERGSAGREPVGRLLRLAHTLKGAARVVKQLPAAELAHSIEEVLAPYRETQVAAPREVINTLLRLLESLERNLRQLDAPPETPPARRSDLAGLQGAPGAALPVSAGRAVPSSGVAESAVPFGVGDAPAGASGVANSSSSIDPGGWGGAGGNDPALATVRIEVREMDRLLENILEAGVQVAALQPTLRRLEECRHLALIVQNQLAALAAHADRQTAALPDSGTGYSGAVGAPGLARGRVLAEDLRSALTSLRNDLAPVLNRAETELLLARDHATQLRLMPAHTIFGALEHAARDAATALDKQLEFATAGGEVRLDAHVLISLRDALQHVVRNAVTHGLEAPAARQAAGKPPAGRVTLSVERQGHRVAFLCRDDGAGIDLAAVRAALVRRGQISAFEAQALDDAGVLDRLLEGGLSTRTDVTDIAGRGIGLDVLRATIAELKGSVDVRSSAGVGTEVELVVPISLAALAALEVEVDGATVAIPLEAVRETLRVGPGDVAYTSAGATLPHRGTAIPYLPLAPILNPAAAAARENAATAVIVASGERLAAVGVDRLKGVSTVVLKPLPPLCSGDPIIAGASLDAAGDPQPMLDPARLVDRAASPGASGAGGVAAPAMQPILVVDDSLTTRMLEQSILESAGYPVEIATSAEEALTKAHAKRYSLFVVDVEMPGMDGFTFVARTREDPALRDIPAILVTSRAAPEDRRRGAQVGARAYIVKGEFDQGFLLQTIRSLVG
ncbi:MAG: hybrid sensor histidine kinase/response regulator [Planctomycetota bacterium]